MKSKNLTLASLFAGLFMFMNPMGREVYKGRLPRAGRYGRNRTYHGLERGPQSNLYLFPGRTEGERYPIIPSNGPRNTEAW